MNVIFIFDLIDEKMIADNILLNTTIIKDLKIPIWYNSILNDIKKKLLIMLN